MAKKEKKSTHQSLGQWYATAICGNDITSSCLYVSALSILYAGPWAPVSLVMVAFVLLLFRGIYAEVVGALPLNGGAYNALLNTTSKLIASIAACLTILSYLATAVISANEAVHYGIEAAITLSAPDLLREYAFFITVALMLVFALLTIRGIGESARVALGIFVIHMISLSMLVIAALVYLYLNGTDVYFSNWSLPPPRPTSYPLLFGFCVALLGISGFESSANFVEEQKPGVFPKTLRNMWIAVSFFNPLICILAISVVPLAAVAPHKEALLAHMANIAGGETLGPVLSVIISIDAALVLSGAVLTSFIGVTGLVHRMTLDRCLPQFLLKLGRFKTFYRVILGFFFLSCLLLFIAEDVHNLAGVYTISFLSVMFLFAVGNAFLKVRRSRLPRERKVSWLTVFVAATAVALGVWGNITLEVHYFKIFILYFAPTLIIVTIMLERTVLFRIGIYMVQNITTKIMGMSQNIIHSLENKLDEVNSQQIIFFTRGDNIANLNRAMLYVRQNEPTNKIKVVTVVNDENEVPAKLAEDLGFLDQAYPEMSIEFIVHKGQFSPELLKELSTKWEIPLNFMFIGSPGDRFPHRLADLGGVRLII